MIQSNWEWGWMSRPALKQNIEAEEGMWYLCKSSSIVSIDHWPVDIHSPACSQRYLLCLLDSRKRRFFISSCFLDMLLITATYVPAHTIASPHLAELLGFYCVWSAQSTDPLCWLWSLYVDMLSTGWAQVPGNVCFEYMRLCTCAVDLW